MLLPGRYLRPRRNLQVPDQLRVVRLQVRPQAYSSGRAGSDRMVAAVLAGGPWVRFWPRHLNEAPLIPNHVNNRRNQNALSMPVRSVLSYMIALHF